MKYKISTELRMTMEQDEQSKLKTQNLWCLAIKKFSNKLFYFESISLLTILWEKVRPNSS